ncbi:Crp/Fnr family transcriptional regulator [Marivivens sp. LCG002]|uniref:Crp/Fnr family transcriptional regulator n=1 Tax=Marivivens sp. LCG002 TaxID=3051171 RepID=UPI002553C617|nr:Crp/Fnr family transcriptional regulator [Marivivens sp. LCG002]WIV51537.1 Crp/Fnr family transcriptional regulator [Marivivens sp. LCG002]
MKNINISNSVRFPHLMRSPLLAGLSDEDRVEFLDACVVQIYENLTDVLVQGGQSKGLYMVAHGALEINRASKGGERVTLLLVQSGQTMGEIESIGDCPVVANVTARRGTTLLLCPRETLLGWMQRPEFLKAWMQQFAIQVAIQNDNRVMDRVDPINFRVGRYLWQFSDRHGVFDRSQSLLAETVGCSRQTVNGVIKEFKEQGLVERLRQGVRIIDRERFEELFGTP